MRTVQLVHQAGTVGSARSVRSRNVMGHTLRDKREAPVCIVYHGAGTSRAEFGVVRERRGDERYAGRARSATTWRSRSATTVRTRWRPAAELFERRRAVTTPAVLLVDTAMLGHAAQLRVLARRIVLVAVEEAAERALGRRAELSAVGLGDSARQRTLRAACELAFARTAAQRLRRRLAFSDRESVELHRIGISLMVERDGIALLHRIVEQGKRLTESDAGGLLLVAGTNQRGDPVLRTRLYEFDSLPDLKFSGRVFPVDNTGVIGHAALTKRPLVIADVRSLPPDAGFAVNLNFDEENGYWTQSMLIVPMVDHRDHVTGVLVFLNRKSEPGAKIKGKADADRYVLPYARRQVRLARSLASQAAVSIENANLYEQLERTLEGVVRAAVIAIDDRDPATSGHAVRVAALTTDLAAAVDRVDHGFYRDAHFTRRQLRELRFAALLHDFGKIGVREDVLVKAKKLPPVLWERVNARFELIRRGIERERRAELDRARRAVDRANEPTVLPAEAPAELADIARRTYEDSYGQVLPYLTVDELQFLQLARGTLDDRERAEIESHVEQTHRYLVQIPWTDDLAQLPAYAYGHHEKLDGSGYPRKLRGDEIPVQTRMMTIADIFDALTASDRPYKRAVPAEKAVEILESEARAGRLDAHLVQIFVESQVFRRVVEADWRRL